jgi:pimeloyl-ACP methyl ester carboxylesterase
MVADLRHVLHQARIEPPYVLVGHSFGGFNVRVFAGGFPEEVAGVVLIDSSHPDQHARLAEALPPESPTESSALAAWRRGFDPNLFGINFRACAEQARSVELFNEIPLCVVSQSPNAWAPPGMPSDIWARVQKNWGEMQNDLTQLSANTRHVVAEYASHAMDLEEPQLIVEAILGVVCEVRHRSESVN